MEKLTNHSENFRDIEREQRLKYKGSKDWFFCPEFIISEQIINLEEQLCRIEIPAFGIEVYTDSDRLIEQISQFNNFSKPDRFQGGVKKLFYITEKSAVPALPNPSNGTGLVEMSSEPADVLCDPDSGIYIINCWDRFTSMESLILGMRSYENLQANKLGIHAALVEKEGQGYILIGKPKTGKTTISLSLAAQGYKLISDDWVEVEKQNDQYFASGANPSISLDQQTLSTLESQYEQYRDIESLGFSSYGKLIMPIKNVNNGWNSEQKIPVRKVFILDNDSQDLESLDKDYFCDLLKITDPHTPFMNLPDDLNVRAVNNESEESRYGIERIKEAQNKRRVLATEFVTSGNHSIEKIRNKDYTLEEAIKRIKDLI